MSPFHLVLAIYGVIAWLTWGTVSIILIYRDHDLHYCITRGALVGVLWPFIVLWSPVVVIGHIRRHIQTGGGK